MVNYLHFSCGKYEFLLTTDCILEVGFRSQSISSDEIEKNKDLVSNTNFRLWRENILPVINLLNFLQLNSSENSYQLVIKSEADAIDSDSMIIDVDDVHGLLEISDDDFVDFAKPVKELDDFIDQAYIQPSSGKCLLRINHPFPWQSISGQ